MAFPAKLFIQGVGSYVPHEDDKHLLVLFPDQAHDDVGKLPRPPGQKICDHYAVVQMDAQHFGPADPGLWLSLDVAKYWIGIAAPGSDVMNDVDRQLGTCLPPLKDVLAKVRLQAFAGLNPQVFPGAQDAELDRLKAGLFLDRGAVKPATYYKSNIEFAWSNGSDLGGNGYPMDDATSVVEVELGQVSELNLRLRPFGQSELSPIPLRPVDGKVEIWIRHFCDPTKPDPQTHDPRPGSLDADFALVYALREDVDGLVQGGKRRLPLPRVRRSASEARRGPRGGKPRQCMGDLEVATAFPSPF